jgi:hypothetical protein
MIAVSEIQTGASRMVAAVDRTAMAIEVNRLYLTEETRRSFDCAGWRDDLVSSHYFSRKQARQSVMFI